MKLTKELSIVNKWTLFLSLGLFTAILHLFPFSFAQAKRGRQMDIGFVVLVKSNPPEQKEIFRESLLEVLKSSYGRRTSTIKMSHYKLDEIIYHGGVHELDHVIVIEGMGAAVVKKEDPSAEFNFSGKIRIIDLSSLKVSSSEDISFRGKEAIKQGARSTKAGYALLSKGIIKKMIPFYNPNIMKHVKIRDVGDYFYQKRDCRRALPIYEKAISKETQFDILDQLNKKQATCKRRVNIEKRLNAKYSANLEYYKLSPQYQTYFDNAFKQGKYTQVFSRYTNKPINILLSYSGQKQGRAPGELLLTMFYDAKRYPVASITHQGGRQLLLDFSSYNGVMISLLRFKIQALQSMAEAQKEFFNNFATRVKIEQPNGDYLTFNVVLDRNNQLLPPRKIKLDVDGYKPVEVEPSTSLIKGKNYFPLGPPFNVDGKETVYSVVYKFFNVKP